MLNGNDKVIRYREKDDRWEAICEKPLCYYRLTHSSELKASNDLNAHNCPYTNGITHYDRDTTMTLVEQLWEMMDADYATLITSNQNDPWQSNDEMTSIALLKGNLRGLARATAVFMTPHFTSADDVVAEVVKRAEMAIKGETYSTPGLGSRIYETVEPSKYAGLRQQTVTEENKLVEPETEAKIIKAWKSGEFSHGDLAEMFMLSQVVIRSIVNG